MKLKFGNKIFLENQYKLFLLLFECNIHIIKLFYLNYILMYFYKVPIGFFYQISIF